MRCCSCLAGSSYECPPSNKSSNPWDSSTCAGKVSWSANESIIVETILPLFERMFAPLGETPHINSNGAGGASWFHYSEANIAGRIPYPDGIKFVILTFPDFFGTGNVTEVRDWCVQWGWPLVCESPSCCRTLVLAKPRPKTCILTATYCQFVCLDGGATCRGAWHEFCQWQRLRRGRPEIRRRRERPRAGSDSAE